MRSRPQAVLVLCLLTLVLLSGSGYAVNDPTVRKELPIAGSTGPPTHIAYSSGVSRILGSLSASQAVAGCSRLTNTRGAFALFESLV